MRLRRVFIPLHLKKIVIRQIFLAILLAGLLAACAQEGPVCSAPYILQGGKCCIDVNNDSACDAQSTVERLDCSLCPPQFVTQKEEVVLYKYVCFNQTVVDKPEDCGKITSNAYLFKPYEAQDPAYIDEFFITPVCRGKFQSAEVYLDYVEAPLNISFQILDDPEGDFRTVDNVTVKDKMYYYVGFCRDCQNLINLQLEPGQAYLIRAVLQYEDFRVYTREELLDPTPSGNIGRKSCT
jgi:hypothetical protein